MATKYSPKIITDGLVLCIDPANRRPYADNKYVADWGEGAGTDTWGAGGGGIAGNIDSIGPSGGGDNRNDCLRFTCNTNTSTHYMHFNNGGNWSSVGDTIRITFDYFVPAGQSHIDGLGMFIYGPMVVQPYYSQMNTTNAWTSIDVSFNVEQSYGFIIYGADGGANTFTDTGNDVFYIRNFTHTELYSAGRMAKRDLSGRDNNLTLVNGTVYSRGPEFADTSRPAGGAFTFDGTNDYATIGDSSDWDFGTTPFAIEVWLKFTDFSPSGDSWNCALQQYAAEGDRNGFMLFYNNGSDFEWRMECTASSPSLTTSHIVLVDASTPANDLISLNSWHLFTISRESQTSFKQYVDGVLKLTDTTSVTFDDIAGTMNVGNYAAGDPHEFQGDMGPLRIYKGRALSDAEVLQNYNAQKARFGK